MPPVPENQEEARKESPAEGDVSPWRMYLEPALRRRLGWGRVAAAGFVALGFLLWMSEREGNTARTPLLGLVLGLSLGGLVLFEVLNALIIARPFCSMCRQPSTRVEALIAARAGAICTACVPVALAALDGERPGARVLQALRTSLDFVSEDLAPRTPRAESSRILGAAMALHPEPEMLRRLAARALRVSNPAAVLEAMGRIPAAERTVAERTVIAVALYDLERYAEAQAELEGLELASLEPVQRGIILNNLAAFALKLDPGLSGEALARARAQAEESGPLVFPNAPPEKVAYYRRRFAGTRAALALRAGEPSVALAVLEEVEAATGSLEAPQWRIRGNARAALGDLAGAREAWEKTVELGHPEETSVREASEHLRVNPGAAPPS
jgi:tetratricopeptide (TPR) repeat protein